MNEAKNTTGIDFEAYRTDELAQRIGNLLQFPKLAFTAFALPTLVLLLLFGGISAALFLSDFVRLGIIFSAFGLISAPITGGIIGIFAISKRITLDLQVLFDVSLTFAQQITTESQNTVKIDNSAIQPSLQQIVQGSNHIAFLPIVSVVLHQQIRIVGGVMTWLIERAFRIIEKAILPDHADQPNTLKEIESQIGNLHQHVPAATRAVTLKLIRPMALGMWLAILGNLWVCITAILEIIIY